MLIQAADHCDVNPTGSLKAATDEWRALGLNNDQGDCERYLDNNVVGCSATLTIEQYDESDARLDCE